MQKSLLQSFVKIHLIILVLTFPILIFYGSYFSTPISAYITYLPSDGWCNQIFSSIGNHCFGDYQYPGVILRDYMATAWQYPIENPHPPLALFLSYFFIGLGNNLLGATAAFILYTCTMYITIFFVIFVWLKNVSPELRFLYTSILTFTTLPILFIFDRGINLWFSVPLISLFYLFFRQHKDVQSMLLFAVLATFRPQFLLISIAFLVFRGWRQFILSNLLALMFLFSSFFLWPGNKLANIIDWINQLIRYGGGLENGVSLYPTSYSLKSGISYILFSFNHFDFIDSLVYINLLETLNTFYTAITVILLLIFMFVLMLCQKFINLEELITLLLLLVVLLPGKSWMNYGIIYIMILLFNKNLYYTERKHKWRYFLLILLMITSLTPIFIINPSLQMNLLQSYFVSSLSLIYFLVIIYRWIRNYHEYQVSKSN
jgi:hypothetical protein